MYTTPNGSILYPENYFNETSLYITQINVPGIKEPILKQDVKISGISPLGMEFIVFNKDMSPWLHQTLDIEIFMRKDVVSLQGVIVQCQEGLTSVKWVHAPSLFPNHNDQRKTPRYICGPEFYPIGVISNPYKFNSFIHFSVEDISLNGAKFITSMRNKTLIPGMSLDTTINFPLIGQTQIGIKIVNCNVISHRGKDRVSVHCQFQKVTYSQKEIIKQYLLQFGVGITNKQLAKGGLKGTRFTAAANFMYVKTKEELDAVIDLREKAWKSDDPNLESFPREKFTDAYDAKSKILYATTNNRYFVTVRMYLPQSQEDFHHKNQVDLPDDLPIFSELCEMTRIVVDPEFKGADVFSEFLTHAVIMCLQAQRRYILSHGLESMIRVYEKFGGKKIGKPFKFHDYLERTKTYLVIFDIHKIALAQDVNPILWMVFGRQLTRYVIENKLLVPTQYQKVRIYLLNIIAPVVVFAVMRLGLLKRTNKSKNKQKVIS